MSDSRRSIEFTPTAGVYRVTHLPSGRSLLGTSRHAQGILNRIRWQLETRVPSTLPVNGHALRAVQRDWNADGAAAFRFEVLDELAPDSSGELNRADLEELLALWRERLALSDNQSY